MYNTAYLLLFDDMWVVPCFVCNGALSLLAFCDGNGRRV